MSHQLRILIISALCGAACLGPARGAAQSGRADLTGPFMHFGGLVGSVSGESAPPSEARTAYGWGVGGGLSISRSSAVVGSYTIFNFREIGAPATVPMEQAEVGVRFRVGGGHSPAVLFVEGGGAWRQTSLTSALVFGDTPPSSATESVAVDGWAGWFGPGVQLYFGRRLAGEMSVAWAWGDMATARVQGAAHQLATPIALTTLRMRLGLAATIF